MAENKRKPEVHIFFMQAAIFILTTAAMYIGGCLKNMDRTALLSNTVLAGLGAGTVLFLMAASKENGTYDYDNGEHRGRFFLLYILALLFAAAGAWLPAAGWPYMIIFIGLSLFSNMQIGAAAGTLLLFMTVMLSGTGAVPLVLYLFCGLAGTALFGRLDENYRIGVPVTVSLLILIAGETAGTVLYMNEELSAELFLVPLMNTIVSAILLIVLLKLFSSLVIHKYRVKYLEINDPEFPLLAELKKCSREEYYKAVHTAYFCDRIARRLDLDADAAKAGGYYHGIGRLQGENTWETVQKACEENKFPPAAVKILKEFLNKGNAVTEKETAVLLFADAVISAVLFLFARQPDVKPDYDQIIDTVFKKKLESGVLKECRLSLGELHIMQGIFKEEKLYYDFLR